MSATSILASLGTAAGIAMALSPLPTIRTIVRCKSTGDFSVFPYIATLCQCALWIGYAVTTSKTALIPVNALVSILEFSYCVIFILFASDRPSIIKTISYPIAITGAAVAVSFISSAPSKFFGFFAVISNIIMYAAPLTVVKTVIETKSVEYMPLLLSLVGTVAAAIWTAWAISAVDYFVLIPNVLGFILGCIQLAVYFKYRNASSLTGTGEETIPTIDTTPDIESGKTSSKNFGSERTGLIRASN